MTDQPDEAADSVPFRQPTAEELEAYLRDNWSPGDKPKTATQPESLTPDDAQRLIKAYAARLKLGLNLYRPLPNIEPFHASLARTRLVTGGNRSGKTSSVAVEIARIACGMDPYKKRADRDLKIGCVGKNETHLADPMWRKLWWPGAFWVVPDEITGQWRVVRPSPLDSTELDPIDMARRRDWRPAPPLIPPHMIKKIAWLKKNQSIPRVVKLSNGTELRFAASGGQPWKGIELDMAWGDEEQDNELWIPELYARLVDRDGLALWSFTPEASTPEYYAMHMKVLDGEPDFAEFTVTIEENPYLPKAAKRAFYDSIKHDPEVLAVKYYGHYGIIGRKVYPEYSLKFQGIEPFPIPENWMRILILDPGVAAAAVLFCAVSPTADHLYIYDEIFQRRSDASKIAKAVAERIAGQSIEAFIIDYAAGRQTSLGRWNTVAEHYAEQFKEHGLASRRTGSGFFWGSDNVQAREISVKHWLRVDEHGDSVLKFLTGNTPNLDSQMKNRYYRKTAPDKREERSEHDVCDGLEYAVAFFDRGLYYQNPMPPESTEVVDHELVEYLAKIAKEGVYEEFLKKKQRRDMGRSRSIELGAASKPFAD